MENNCHGTQELHCLRSSLGTQWIFPDGHAHHAHVQLDSLICALQTQTGRCLHITWLIEWFGSEAKICRTGPRYENKINEETQAGKQRTPWRISLWFNMDQSLAAVYLVWDWLSGPLWEPPVSWLPCRVRPVLKMLNEMGKNYYHQAFLSERITFVLRLTCWRWLLCVKHDAGLKQT